MSNGYKNIELQRYIRNIGMASFTVTSETVAIAAGAAGTLKTCQLEARPILDALGSDNGALGDTSLVLTSTAFTTEIAPTDDANMSNGQYWVDYATGKIRGKKADTSTSMTATYKTLVLNSRERYLIAGEDGSNGLLGTQNKPVANSTYTWSLDFSAALEASTITKAAPGVLRQVVGRIDSTHASATYYWQTYNSTTLPADGAVTLLTAPLKIVHTNGTNSFFTIDYTMNGVFASIGIVQALSTTEFTKTISGAFTSTNTLFK